MNLFEKELAAYNPSYGSLSTIVISVWRHGLTHNDEPPCLVSKNMMVMWRLNAQSESRGRHLILDSVEYFSEDGIDKCITRFEFNTYVFMEHLIKLCEDLAKVDYSKRILRPKEIYNSWFAVELPKNKNTGNKKMDRIDERAIQQISDIFRDRV